MTTPTPRMFHQKPVHVEAMQFNDWPSAVQIMHWTRGRVYYVPPGFEHRLRLDNENDIGNGQLRDDAVAFLVIFRSDDGSMHRLNPGGWVVRHADGPNPSVPVISGVTAEDFAATYDPGLVEDR